MQAKNTPTKGSVVANVLDVNRMFRLKRLDFFLILIAIHQLFCPDNKAITNEIAKQLPYNLEPQRSHLISFNFCWHYQNRFLGKAFICLEQDKMKCTKNPKSNELLNLATCFFTVFIKCIHYFNKIVKKISNFKNFVSQFYFFVLFVTK